MKKLLLFILTLGMATSLSAADIYPAKDFRVNTGAILIILDKMEATYVKNQNVPNDDLKALWNSMGLLLNKFAPLPKKATDAQSEILNEFHTIYINYAAWIAVHNPVQSSSAIEIIREHHTKVRKLCSDYNFKTKGRS